MKEGAFFCGVSPSVIMTDNCDELRQALEITWPGARLLLCIFHILQQAWRWLHEKIHGVRMEDRPPLLRLIKSLLYAKTVVELRDLVGKMKADDVVKLYANVSEYFEN